MHTKQHVIESLKEEHYILDNERFQEYVKLWKIDPVFEDEDGIEYFDDLSISKLKQGIDLKNKGKNDLEIISHLNRELSQKSEGSLVATGDDKIQIKEGLSNVTVDITNQTLNLLAESIAQKITLDITEKVKDTDFFKPVMNNGKLKRDNEVLAKQVEKLIEENKKLISRNNFLQQEYGKFKHILGNVYIKQD